LLRALKRLSVVAFGVEEKTLAHPLSFLLEEKTLAHPLSFLLEERPKNKKCSMGKKEQKVENWIAFPHKEEEERLTHRRSS
jgi:hypothetical protein